MHAWSISMLLLLHSVFMLSAVKLMLKEEAGICALNSHGNYIVDHGKSWETHGIVFLNFCGIPDWRVCSGTWIFPFINPKRYKKRCQSYTSSD